MGDVGDVGALGISECAYEFFGLIEFCGLILVEAIEDGGVDLGRGKFDGFGRVVATELESFEELLVFAEVVLAEGYLPEAGAKEQE